MRFGHWFCWLFGHKLTVPHVGNIGLVTLCTRCGAYRNIFTVEVNR